MQEIRTAESEGRLSRSGQQMVAATKPEEELFDCLNDPLELNNLANDPAYTEMLLKMRDEHARWSDDTKDTGLIPETILRTWESENNMAIYDLMRTTEVPVQEIRETALAQLSVDKLEENLFHQNEAVRYWAAISLGNQADKISDLQLLHKALDDATPVVRFAAARALSKVGQATMAIPVIEKGLKNSDEWVRLNAAQVLDEMEEQARPALTSLQQAMQDENKYVVRVVNHAINQLLKTDHEVP